MNPKMNVIRLFICLMALSLTIVPSGVYADVPPTWSDEFNGTGKPDSSVWGFETGFARNEELQWYTTNAWQEGGNLIIEGRQETVLNPNYTPGSPDWKLNRQYAYYTSASIVSSGKKYWLYGRTQIRAKIPCLPGMWPAIWGCGQSGGWPSCGEVDILEFYQSKILANCARSDGLSQWGSSWDTTTPDRSIASLTAVDPGWTTNWHIWTMQWDQQNVRLYVDNALMGTVPQTWLVNPNTTWGPKYPFQQPFTIWLNLAIGGQGGDPSATTFPQRYYVDYWRIWEGATNNVAPTNITLSANIVEDGAPAGTLVGYLLAEDADPAEVFRYTLVTGTGDTHNNQFSIPAFLSDTTTLGALKTAAVLLSSGGATRSIRVRVTDIEGATFDKILTINVGKNIDTSTNAVTVPEGATASFNVRLRALPVNTVTVNVARVSGDTDLTVTSGSQLLFTAVNGTNWQQVTMSAAEDEDNVNSSAVFRCSDADGVYLSATVTAYEADNDNLAPVADAGSDQSVTLSGPVWTPSAIPTVAWYDAADAATLITNATGYVSQWNDKSSNAHHAVQAAGTAQPARQLNQLNGLPAVYFDGIDDSLAAAGSNAVRNLFVVCNASGTTFSAWRWVYGTLEGTDVPALFGYSGTSDVMSEIPVKGGRLASLRINGVDNATCIYSFAPLSSYKVVSVVGNSASAVKGGWAIGIGDDAPWLGSIAELITTDTAMTTETRQQAEGYLAHKWGLTNSLPIAHPYKSAVPCAASAIVSLDGTVSDPNGDAITSTWSQVSGPGGVLFGNSNAVDTTVTITVPGVYVIRLTANDGSYQAFDDVTITVYADTDNDGIADNWEIANFGNLTTTAGSLTDDQDNDGFIDLYEYLAGTNPTNGSSRLILESASPSAGGSKLVLTWPGVAGKKYQVLSSTNLMQSGWRTNMSGIDGVAPTTTATNDITNTNSYFLIKLE